MEIETRKKSSHDYREQRINSCKEVLSLTSEYDVMDDNNLNITLCEEPKTYTTISERMQKLRRTIISSNDVDVYLKLSKGNLVDGNNVYMIMKKKETKISGNENDILESTIAELTIDIQQLNYLVPEFNFRIAPIVENWTTLFCHPIIKITSNIDADIFYASKLKEEAQHPGGVQVKMTKYDILGMRVVLSNGDVWIAKCPRDRDLKGQIHVGDKIIGMNNKKVVDLDILKDSIKSKPNDETFTFTIQRLSEAKIFVVKIDNYDSILNFDEDNNGWILKNYSNINSNLIWLITEIDGTSVENVNEQVLLKDYFERKSQQYLSIVMHDKYFISKFLKIKLI